jgi:DHA2 family multidrug resistance protein-like MFS transporter
MVLTLAIGPFLLPEYRDVTASRVDLLSVALSLATLLPVVYGLKELANGGWQPGPVTAIVAGVAGGVVFVRRQRALSDPLLDLRLFRDRAIAVTLGAMLMYSMLSGGTMTFLAQHFQLVNGLSPLGAGIAMVPGMASSIVSFQLAGLLGRRVRPACLFSGGLAVTVAGMLVISQSAGTAALATGFAIAAFGTGPLVSLGTSLVIGAVPPARAGAAAGLAQTGNECGLPLGVAVLGSAGLLGYRLYLSAHPGEAPRIAAQHAFTAELHVIAAIAAIALAVVALVIATTLRRISPLGAPPEQRPEPPSESSLQSPGPAAAAQS